MADGFKVADAYVEIHGDKTALKRDIADLPNAVGPDAERAGKTVGQRVAKGVSASAPDGERAGKTVGQRVAKGVGDGAGPGSTKAGKDSGDKLSQGMQLALVRNSPLIAAAIAGALTAGAPVALAGATALFAGIGIAAAAMNDEVQKHWSAAWQSIVTGTKEDASVLQRTVADLADDVGASFTRLRPELQEMFVALAPIIDKFGNSLLQAAENAMPGFLNAVKSAGPVMDGLGNLIEDIGTGVSQFFDILSQHSGASGEVFSSLGQIIQAILPILAQLLGAGAELAADVLPAISGALSIVAGLLDKIAPVLPTVAAGFAAFKAVGVVSNLVGGLANALGDAADKGGAFAAVQEQASTALDKVKDALPFVAVLTAGVTVALSDMKEQQEKVTSGMEGLYRTVQLGGPQAAEAQKLLNQAAENGSSSFLGLGVDVKDSLAQADAATKQWWNSMTPLQQAQEIVTARQNDLNVAVDKYGPSSLQANEATAAYKAAQAELAAQEAATQMAINGVTDAMLAQANQALANASASFAYDQATQQVADAQIHLAEVQNDSKSTAADLNNATNSLNQALLSQVEAAGRLASEALPATASETQKTTAANGAMLQQLYALRNEMGSAFPAALQNAIIGLQNSGATANNYSAQAMNALGATNNLIGGLFNLGAQHPQPAVTVQPGNSLGILGSVKSAIDALYSKTIYVTTIKQTVSSILGGLGSAEGGPTNAIPNVIKAASGRVVGPGTGTSDSVPAIGPGGQPWALSNDEWVINARVSNEQGDARMAALNSGRAQIVPTNPATGTGATNGGNVYHVNVNLHGTFDFSRPDTMRTFGVELRKVLQKLDKEVN